MTDQRQNAWVCAQALGAEVLHVGCGDGEATIMLGRKHKSVVGTEPGADDLADARHRLVEEDEEVQGRVRFVTCRPTKLPFERNAFDGVVLSGLQRQLDLEAAIGELARVLRPQGRIVVVAPDPGAAPEGVQAPAGLASLLEALGRRVAIDLVEEGDEWIGLAGRPRARASGGAGRQIPIEALEVVERRLERVRLAQREQARLLAAAQPNAERLTAANEALEDRVFGLTHDVKALRGRERDLLEIVAGRREQTARLEEQRESMLARLVGLEEQIDAREQDAAELRRQAGENEALARREADARERYAQLRGRMEDIQASLSYRLMRRLWRVKAALGRPFRRSRTRTPGDERAPAEPSRRPIARGQEAKPPAHGQKAELPAARSFEADVERSRWLSEARPPRAPTELRLATVLDDISRACFAPECELISFGPEDWRESLEDQQPHLLLVESSWQGNGGSWQYQVASYSHPDYVGLPKLKAVIEWCREREIPTVFWNKEDPVHFDRFSEAAPLFDHVFTTDSNCIPRYQALQGMRARTIEALPFAAQPQLHNPIALSGGRSDSPCFAGAYYRDRHADRRRSLEMLLDAARPFDLVIYDRRYGSEDEAFGFPERFAPHIRRRLTYDEMLREYKAHKLFLNVNSVTDSPTMFSRRVFELLACDTAVLSTESVGVASAFGDLVPIVETPEDATRSLERLLGDEEYRRRLVVPARRLVMSEHTYRRRLAVIAAAAGYEVAADHGEEFAVLVLVDDVQQARGVRPLVTSISEQTTIPTEFLIGVGTGTSVAGDLQRLSDAAEGLRVRVMHQDAESSRGERFRELAAVAASPWLAVVHTAHTYGRHHFTDLLACTRFTDADADVIGNAAFSLTSGEALNADLEHRFVDFVHPHSILVRRELVAKRGWPDEMPAIWAVLDDWRREGLRYYSGDRENFRAEAALGLPPRRADSQAAAVRANQ